MTSLNPVYTIEKQLNEVYLTHQKISKEEASKKSLEMLNAVKIPNAKSIMKQYPHQLSGGMRQRVMIAMALSCSPSLLIADEPTTALDVTIQAQIIDLMVELKKNINASIILITHDMGVVAEMADYIMVMYAGKVMEYGSARQIFKEAMHPYTQGLLASIPYSEGGYWQLYWGQIRIINTFLQRAATAAIPRESDRDRWVAEAHVLRAYFYMELLKWYGPVPIEKEPYGLDYDYSTLSRPTFEDCARFIVDDCEIALQSSNLPWRLTTLNEKIRMTKGIAMEWASWVNMPRQQVGYCL